MVSDRQTDGRTDIATYRAAIAARNCSESENGAAEVNEIIEEENN